MYEHDHRSHEQGSSLALRRALYFTLGFAIVEAIAGYFSGSLALIGDAGHMFTDSSALGFAVLAAWIARRPSSRRHSWGMGRAEVIAALGNAVFMVAVAAAIIYNATLRLHHPEQVVGGAVTVVALIGLGVNVMVLKLLGHSHGHAHGHGHDQDHGHDHDPPKGAKNINLRGATLHALGDLLGSVAALASGVVVLLTGWMPIDPILSIVISVLIILSSFNLLRDGLHIVMEGVPRHLNLNEIGDFMAATEGVLQVHDLHIWQVNSERVALSAHVVLRRMEDWLPTLAALNKRLNERYGIDHATLQPEPVSTAPLPTPGKTGLREPDAPRLRDEA